MGNPEDRFCGDEAQLIELTDFKEDTNHVIADNRNMTTQNRQKLTSFMQISKQNTALKWEEFKKIFAKGNILLVSLSVNYNFIIP